MKKNVIRHYAIWHYEKEIHPEAFTQQNAKSDKNKMNQDVGTHGEKDSEDDTGTLYNRKYFTVTKLK